MPRSVWKGALNFGLVNVPVGLYSATQDKTIHFNQFEEGTSDRIRYKKVNERTGQEVPAGRIVKGYDLGGGEYVLLTDEELESAEPTKSHLIEITDFVDLDRIDPVFYRSTYYLAPEGEAAVRLWDLTTGWLEFPTVYEVQRPKSAADIDAIATAFSSYLEARDWFSVQNPTP